MTTYIASICEQNNIRYINSHAVSGGDINASFAVDTTDGRMFLKLNSASQYPQMFTKETEGLKALAHAGKLKVPEVIATGVLNQQQYLLLEWLERATPSKDFWCVFAEALCGLHRITQQQFGWTSSNYIGSLLQQNQPKQTWAEFYATQRIMPLVEELFNRKSFSSTDTKAAESVCVNLKEIFPDEPPALVHGDLWSGNFMAVHSNKDKNIVPAAFDPAVYFGHREMDLSMTLLFGGFSSEFYSAYNAIIPLEKNWRKRETLTQLYPLLVHALLFGGSYASRCKSIINEWA
jgi:fructosamine-3-kinase